MSSTGEKPNAMAVKAKNIKEELEQILSKVSWGKGLQPLVMTSKTVILTPQRRAQFMPPISGEVPSLGQKIKGEILSLKQRADKGDAEAIGVLYNVATFGVLVLDSLHNLEGVRSVAQNKSIWPIMGSPEDSMIKMNNETFTRIGLGSKMTTRAIPSLLRHDSIELYWAEAIWVEINRMRDFVTALSPETKSKLFNESDPVWPCKIGNNITYLDSGIILECEKLPPPETVKFSKNAWWKLVEKIFEIATNSQWEKIPDLRKTHVFAAKNSGANPESYIRSNIKKNLKNKFFSRIFPLAKGSKEQPA